MIEEKVVVDMSLRDRLSKSVNKLKSNFQGFNKALGMNVQEFKQSSEHSGNLNDRMKELNNRGFQAGSRFRMATAGLKGFKMEMLGIMFFGMAMQRMFTGLLKPAAGAFGIMDLWSDMLTVVFLPTMVALMPYFIDLVTNLMNMSDGAKMMLGQFTLAGVVLGTFLFVVGTLALGIGALIMAGLPLIMTALTIVVVIGLAIAAIIFITKAVKNFKSGNMVDGIGAIGIALAAVGAIILVFGFWWALIPIAVGIAIALITKNWDRFKLFFQRMWIYLQLGFDKFILNMLEKLKSTMEFLAKFSLAAKAAWSLAEGAVNRSIDNQKAKIGELNNELQENIDLRDQLKYGGEAGTSENANSINPVSGIATAQDQYINGAQSQGPSVVQNNTLQVRDDAEIQRVMKDTMDSLFSKYARNT